MTTMFARALPILNLFVLACALVGCTQSPADPEGMRFEVLRDMADTSLDQAVDGVDDGHGFPSDMGLEELDEPSSVEDMRSETLPDMQEEPIVWTWQGYEVVGYTTRTRDEILVTPPVLIGARSDTAREPETRRAHREWGERVRAQFDFADVSVTSVDFDDGATFLVVDITERGEEWRTQFAPAPAGTSTLSSRALRDAYIEYDRMVWDRFFGGDFDALRTDIVYDEHGPYVTYPNDEELRETVEQMRVLAVTHRQELIELLATSSRDVERGMAARLLTWAGSVEQTIEQCAVHLNDPYVLVRNNIGLLILSYLELLEDEPTVRAVVDGLMRMHTRPSHPDRNKSVTALELLAERHEYAREYIRAHEHLKFVRRTADQSVLRNVGPPAQRLLELLDAP